MTIGLALAALLALVGACVGFSFATASDGPTLPRGDAAGRFAPLVGAPPSIATWAGAELGSTWLYPGDLKSVRVVERQPDGTWRHDAPTRVDGRASGLLRDDGRSFVDRALAYYRHFAGVPTDLEPPGAR